MSPYQLRTLGTVLVYVCQHQVVADTFVIFTPTICRRCAILTHLVSSGWFNQQEKSTKLPTVFFLEDYIRVLSHAAARGAMANYALHERLRQLQGFLARNNRLVLDQETHAALAKLGLCC